MLQGTQRLARPKFCLQGAYNESMLHDINGGMSYKYKTLLLLPSDKTFKAFDNLKFRRPKISFCLFKWFLNHIQQTDSRQHFEQSLARQLAR